MSIANSHGELQALRETKDFGGKGVHQKSPLTRLSLQVHILIEHCLVRGLDALESQVALQGFGIPSCVTCIGAYFRFPTIHFYTFLYGIAG